MSATAEQITITPKAQTHADRFCARLFEEMAHALTVWLGRDASSAGGKLQALDSKNARLVLPEAGFGHVAEVHSETPPIVAVHGPGLARALAAAAEGEDPGPANDDSRTGLDDQVRPAAEALNRFFAGFLFDARLHRPESGRKQPERQLRVLEDGGWDEGDDPLGNEDRFAHFEGQLAVEGMELTPVQLLVPWTYAAALFEFGADKMDNSTKGGGAPAAVAQASASANEGDGRPPSLATLARATEPPPLPTTPPPPVILTDLQRYRPPKPGPLRYMRGHQMAETRELSPIVLVGSATLMPVLTGAHQDREVWHVNDGSELEAKLKDGLIPAAVLLHVPVGHEPWLVASVGLMQYRELLERRPVAVILDDPSLNNILICGRVGLVNVLSPATTTEDLLELLRPHLN